jgi:hypothetical protein
MELSVNFPGQTYMEYSGNVQGTFRSIQVRSGPFRSIQGTFGEH